MNTTLRILACAAALLAASAANATTYNFSYTFSERFSGQGTSLVTGSFDGTASGNLITDLTNISVFRDGEQFGSGNLYSFLFTGRSPAVASFDGLENNFLFSTSSYQIGGGNYNGNTFGISTQYHDAYVQGGNGGARGDNYSATRWSVTAVPEPATYAMLLGGLGLVGAMVRRRAV
jgi:hypothetical protein